MNSTSSAERPATARPTTRCAQTVGLAPPAVSHTQRRPWPVHGALLAPPDSTVARVGYLVSVRSTQLHVARIDDITADLLVDAACITRSENNILYQFSVSAAGKFLLEGRAAVVLNADILMSGVTP